MSYTTPHYYPKKEIKTNEFVDEQSVQLIFVHCQCLTPRLPGVCGQFYQALPEAANNMLLLLSSRRASAQAVISKWQLRTTSPMNTNSSVGENWFLAKNGSWPGRL